MSETIANEYLATVKCKPAVHSKTCVFHLKKGKKEETNQVHGIIALSRTHFVS